MDPGYENFKGKIIFHAQATAQEGQADKFEALGKAIKNSILAGNEPGCLTFRLSRNGNEFSVFEEYANAAAVEAHSKTPEFRAFIAEIQTGTVLVGPPQGKYYEEV